MPGELREIQIAPAASAAGKAICELNLPDEFLVILIERDHDYIIPHGAVVLQPGDVLLALANQEAFEKALPSLTFTEESDGNNRKANDQPKVQP